MPTAFVFVNAEVGKIREILGNSGKSKWLRKLCNYGARVITYVFFLKCTFKYYKDLNSTLTKKDMDFCEDQFYGG